MSTVNKQEGGSSRGGLLQRFRRLREDVRGVANDINGFFAMFDDPRNTTLSDVSKGTKKMLVSLGVEVGEDVEEQESTSGNGQNVCACAHCGHAAEKTSPAH